MAHDIFISHSSKDKTVADATCACLESRGLRCWIAPRDIIAGAEWGAAIIDGIQGAMAMVLILSSHSNISPQVLREIERAASHGIPILPLRIENVVLTKSLEYFLSSTHWLDAFHGELRQHLEKLANNVAVLIEKQDAVRPLENSVDTTTTTYTAYRVAREGECRACGTVTADLAKKFCRNPECGASLRVPCLKCNTQIPVWDDVCGECGWNRLRPFDRQERRLYVVLLDTSLSMHEPITNGSVSKIDDLGEAVHMWLRWLRDLWMSHPQKDGFASSCDIAIIRYGTDEEGSPIVESALAGPLAGRDLVTLGEIAENPARFEEYTTLHFDDQTGELVEGPQQLPIWVELTPRGGTPICSAINKACGIVDEWITRHGQGSPPIVINITDGESSEGDPTPYAEVLKQRATDNGNVLFFNCCLSAGTADLIMFAGDGGSMPDDFARHLFQMSSPLPQTIVDRCRREGLACGTHARGIAYNADSNRLRHFLIAVATP